MVSITAPYNYCGTAKITEAILNKIKVCGTFIVKFGRYTKTPLYINALYHLAVVKIAIYQKATTN